MMDDIIPPQPAGSKQTAKLKLPPTDSEPPKYDPTNLDLEPTPDDKPDPKPETSTKLLPKHSQKPKWWQLRHANMSKKQKILTIVAIILLLIIGMAGAFYLFKHFSKTAPLAVQPKATKHVVKPKLVPSRLTGVLISPDLDKRPITGVMIENSPDARPQSGLLDAGVVYEAIAEGGITRFLALYEEAQPDYIGPIRSARPYYLDFIMPFQGSLAHVGGSPEALGQISSLGVRDLDEFANGSYYQRVNSRYAPHNVYTSIAKLNALEQLKGYTTSTFTGFARKKDNPAKTPTVTKIDFSISGYLYSVHYDYDASTNSYKRSEGGAAHLDEKSKAQLSPKVVIATVMSYSLENDDKHSQYGTVGSGQAYIFQDGGVTIGTWNKASRTDQIIFKDSSGKQLKLNAGQTWISLVNASSAVTYKP